MTKAPILFIIAKEPRLGQGKSRLARGFGSVEALRINRALHRVTQRSTQDTRWRRIVALTPDRAVKTMPFGIWPATIARIAQGRGDLGARLARIVQSARNTPIIMIGTDCPALTQRLIAAAITSAHRNGVHAIPADDGGFVLLAARRGHLLAGAFDDVRWSSAQTLADVAARLAARGQRISLSAPLADIDTPEDWLAATRARTARSCG